MAPEPPPERSQSEAERLAVTLARLQEITLELSGALTPAQVAEVVARKGVAAMGATLALVFVPSADGEWLEIVGHEASTVRLREVTLRIRTSANAPASRAYRRGVIEAVETEADYRARYPELQASPSEIGATRASLTAPLLLEGRAIGALSISFREERRFSVEERSFALTLARQCAQALDRARLFEAERRLNERLRLLAQAGDMLSSSLDYETTLENVVGLAIPALADACFLSVLEGAAWRRLARTSGEPAEDGMITGDHWERAIGDRIDTAAITSGRATLHPDLDETGSLEALRALGICSMIAVPLEARGETLGVLTLAFASSRRHHTVVDLDLAEELARRAATAIENARLHRASREATRLAEQANQAKDEFLGVVSHELRTPLNAILGWSQLLRGERSRTQALIDRGLGVIDRNARAQAKLIEDILDVSRIISGKLRLELKSIDLDTVIRSSVEVVRPTADVKGVEVIVATEPGLVVTGDPDRLQQVVGNLIQNAIKFTPDGGVVEVRLEPQDHLARIIVSDSGAGIEPELLPHVFERFRQGDGSTTRRHGGLGLGLAIVRHLVELHGGTVRAESEGRGRGSTFTVRLPLSPESFAPISPPPPADLDDEVESQPIPRIDRLKVLVVDDELDAQEMIATMLTMSGAEVATVSSVDEALVRLERFPADVLVSDVGMPGKDGYTLIRTIRASGAPWARIPAIALTAYASIEDARRAALAGFHAHLAKPAEPAVLISLVRNLGRRPGTLS